jgi:polyribonucleotide 5'-hydroxyl-kinase
MSETEEPEWRNYTLHPQHELRLETEDLQGITVKLTSGTAEIYGVELATDREYVVKHRKLAIYTYRGCEMMILGECSLAYQSSETPMVQYINVHYNLEIMRKVSFDTGNPGPRVRYLLQHTQFRGGFVRCWLLDLKILGSLCFLIFL